MAYNPTLLTRLTSGEVGRDQAVIDYFYYDPQTSMQTMMTKGFFDGAGYLFYNSGNPKTWHRISILARRGYGTNPERPERFSAVVSDVTVTSPAGQPPTSFEVTLALGDDTSYQVDDTAPITPAPDWHNYFIKYRGICRYTSNHTPTVPTIIEIPSNYAWDPSDFSTAILLANHNPPVGNPNPVPGDAIVASFVEPGATIAKPLRVRLIPAGVAGGYNQRVWITIYSSICKYQ